MIYIASSKIMELPIHYFFDTEKIIFKGLVDFNSKYVTYSCVSYNYNFTDYDVINKFAYHVPEKIITIPTHDGDGVLNNYLRQYVVSKLVLGL